MKYLYLILSILSFSTSIAMEPANPDSEYEKARKWICSKDDQRQKYHDASFALLEAIVRKDITQLGKIIDSFPKEGKAYLISTPVDYHAISYEYQLQRKYPQLYAQYDKLPYTITPLGMAILVGDQKAAELLHAHKVRMDFMCDRKGILEYAVEHGPTLIPFLISCGANVHANNEAALFVAARLNKVDVVPHLLMAGANLSARSRSELQLTPLHVAGNHGNYEIAKFFLENGAAVDATDPTGKTPLHRCTMNKQSHIAMLLLEHGANIAATDNQGTLVTELLTDNFQSLDALHLIKNGAPYPRSKKHQDLVWEGLERSLSFDSPAYKKFVHAIVEGKTDIALQAINEATGNELNDVTYTTGQYTFLHWATIRNNLTAVNELLNRRTSQSSALRTAALAIPLISHTVQHPVIIDARDSHGHTPLMWAARLGLQPIYHALKQAGADENLRDSKGNNAFMLAALGGHMGMALESKTSGLLTHTCPEK